MSNQTHDLPAECIMVVFGASGDLAARKIIPALYNLQREDLLPTHIRVVGFARSSFTTASFREHLLEGLRRHSRIPPENDPEAWSSLKDNILYCRGNYDSVEDINRLKDMIEELESNISAGQPNRLFYFAVPPDTVKPLVHILAETGLIQRLRNAEEEEKGFRRVVLEKPFGHDLASAAELNDTLQKHLEENQIYRMDHYLGKETVQNIMVLRFANSLFEPVWNNKYVDHVHVTVAESDGVGKRGKYFDSSGALRDVMQNHVLQLLALFAMEPPSSTKPDAVRAEKVKLLSALAPLSDEDICCSVLRGQYGPGKIEGQEVPGYREEQGVAPDSNTETFAAIRAHINNWRWSGVPFYLSTGKRLARKLTEVAIGFKDIPHQIFSQQDCRGMKPNMLRIQVEPDERVALRITTKTPGLDMNLTTVDMDLPYSARFTGQSPEAYERLVLDAMAGNPSLFASAEEIELAWRYLEPVLQFWRKQPPSDFPDYAAGSWGPIEGEAFFRKDICYDEAKNTASVARNINGRGESCPSSGEAPQLPNTG
jgi:glucose-6-phosphate 1-dehydrogenase